MPHPIYSSSEIASRGKALYDSQIRQQIGSSENGKYVAIDVITGSYEVGEDHLNTTKRALAKYPNAALFVVRVGYPATGRIGSKNLKTHGGLSH